MENITTDEILNKYDYSFNTFKDIIKTDEELETAYKIGKLNILRVYKKEFENHIKRIKRFIDIDKDIGDLPKLFTSDERNEFENKIIGLQNSILSIDNKLKELNNE